MEFTDTALEDCRAAIVKNGGIKRLLVLVKDMLDPTIRQALVTAIVDLVRHSENRTNLASAEYYRSAVIDSGGIKQMILLLDSTTPSEQQFAITVIVKLAQHGTHSIQADPQTYIDNSSDDCRAGILRRDGIEQLFVLLDTDPKPSVPVRRFAADAVLNLAQHSTLSV